MRDEDKPPRKQKPLTPEQHARWRAAMEASSRWLPGQPDALKLTALWNQTEPRLSTIQIAQRMGVTKNAAVGAAHRLKLPPRLSPIRASDEPKKPPQPRWVGKEATLPPLASARVNAVPMRPPPIVREAPRCCWPIGNPGAPDFRMCDEPAERPAKPYCAEHAARAYAKPEHRQPATPTEVQDYIAENGVVVQPRSGVSGMMVAVNNHRRKRGLTPYQLTREPAYG